MIDGHAGSTRSAARTLTRMTLPRAERAIPRKRTHPGFSRQSSADHCPELHVDERQEITEDIGEGPESTRQIAWIDSTTSRVRVTLPRQCRSNSAIIRLSASDSITRLTSAGSSNS